MALWDWTRTTPKWAFVVDTDAYAGNFERELSCYVVGRCDEHGYHRGEPYRVMYYADLRLTSPIPDRDPFESLVEERVDDHGDDFIGRAPMALAPTPGFEKTFRSVAIFLTRKPRKAELALLVRRAYLFAQLAPIEPWDHRPKILGCRLVAERVQITSARLVPPKKQSHGKKR